MLAEGGLNPLDGDHRLIGFSNELRSRPVGRLNNCKPPTCMGCSRDSVNKNIESVGDISLIALHLSGTDVTHLVR